MPDARFVANRFRRRAPDSSPPDPVIRQFHASLPGYAPTPLVRRRALARRLGVEEVYVKYEGSRFGLGAFKGLGAAWAIHCLTARAPNQSRTLSTASAGNHGRAVAWAARLHQLPCVIFLPSSAAPERVANIEREGARVITVEGTYEDAVRECDATSAREGWQVISDVGYDGYLDIPRDVVAGYSTLFMEIDEQLASTGWPPPSLVLVPGGVGGILHAGGAHFDGPPGPRVVGVEPAAADCLTTSFESVSGTPTTARGHGRTAMACLDCAEVSLSSWPAIRDQVDGMLAIDERHATDAVRRLYNAEDGDEAIEAGASGAAAMGGLLALTEDARFADAAAVLGAGPGARVLVLCTEAAIDRADFDRCLRG